MRPPWRHNGGVVSLNASQIIRLLHYWWPMVLGWSVTVVAQRASGRSADTTGLAVLLTGILAAYSLDRAIDRPTTEGVVLSRLLLLVGALAGLWCVVAACRLPVRTAALVPALGAASLTYPSLKRHIATKVVVLPGVWTWACLALPFGNHGWLGWRALMQPVALPLLLLMAAGCILCDLKDSTADRLNGIHSLPVLIGERATVRVAALLSVAAAAAALAEHRPGLAVGAGALTAATRMPGVLATEATGPLLVDLILTLPGVLLSAHLL